MESRIGYFTFDSVNSLNHTIEEFKAEPVETTTGKALVTADQFEDLKQQVEGLQQKFNHTFSTLTQLGIDSIAKKLEVHQPPHGKQEWNHTLQDQREGITRSDLIRKLGFDSVYCDIN